VTPYGSDLEVVITCNSTSNNLLIQAYISQYSTEGAGKSGHFGLLYSTDSFSSETILGEREFIEPYVYHDGPTGTQGPVFYQTWVQCPTTSEIKIRPSVKSYSGNIQLFGNSSSTNCVTSLVVQEIAQ
jgi:hypothetical protein